MRSVLDNRTVRARAEHRCLLCTLPIEAGSRYEYQRYVEDDAFYEVRTHSECTHLARAVTEERGWSLDDSDGAYPADCLFSAVIDDPVAPSGLTPEQEQRWKLLLEATGLQSSEEHA